MEPMASVLFLLTWFLAVAGGYCWACRSRRNRVKHLARWWAGRHANG